MQTEQEWKEKAERLERELDVEKKKTSRERAKNKRDAQRKTPKVLPPPWADTAFAKVTSKPLSPAVILAAAGVGLTEYGLDVGPPPNGMHGVPQKGSANVPRITIEYWIRRAVDQHPGDLDSGLAAGAMRVEQKMDEAMLTAREYAVRAFRVVIYLYLLEVLRGDTARAQAEFPKFDIMSFDPAAIDPLPIITTGATPVTHAMVAPVAGATDGNVAADDRAADGLAATETKDAYAQDPDAALEEAAERFAGARTSADEAVADGEEVDHG